MIIINVGISGSGKTTWTRDFCITNLSFLRINRDDIRRVLVGGNLKLYYERRDLYKIEEMINDIEVEMFYDISKSNYNLIIDNTSLSIGYIRKWMELAKESHKEIKIKFYDCDLEEAKKRVKERDGIDTTYIERQYRRYENIKKVLLTHYKEYIYAGET